MITKKLKDTLVCWPKITPEGEIRDARVVKPGETVRIRENEQRSGQGRMPVIVGDKILFCSREQFWKAAR